MCSFLAIKKRTKRTASVARSTACCISCIIDIIFYKLNRKCPNSSALSIQFRLSPSNRWREPFCANPILLLIGVFRGGFCASAQKHLTGADIAELITFAKPFKRSSGTLAASFSSFFFQKEKGHPFLLFQKRNIYFSPSRGARTLLFSL